MKKAPTERLVLENLLAAEQLLEKSFVGIIREILSDVLLQYPLKIILERENSSKTSKEDYSRKLSSLIKIDAFSKHLNPLSNLTSTIERLLANGNIAPREVEELKQEVKCTRKLFEKFHQTYDEKNDPKGKIMKLETLAGEIQNSPTEIEKKVHLLAEVVDEAIETIRSEAREEISAKVQTTSRSSLS